MSNETYESRQAELDRLYAEIAGLQEGLRYKDKKLYEGRLRETKIAVTIKELRQEISRLQRLILKGDK